MINDVSEHEEKKPNDPVVAEALAQLEKLSPADITTRKRVLASLLRALNNDSRT